MNARRWTVTVSFRNGSTPQVHQIEELSELHDLVERGPAFHAIAAITITYNRGERDAAA